MNRAVLCHGVWPCMRHTYLYIGDDALPVALRAIIWRRTADRGYTPRRYVLLGGREALHGDLRTGDLQAKPHTRSQLDVQRRLIRSGARIPGC